MSKRLTSHHSNLDMSSEFGMILGIKEIDPALTLETKEIAQRNGRFSNRIIL